MINFADTIDLVVLNCSHSGMGDDLSKYIDFVIECKGTLLEDDAIDFSGAFYTAIANEIDLLTAFNLGSARILQSQSKYVLYKPVKNTKKRFVSSP
jgi:hypothetical protein